MSMGLLLYEISPIFLFYVTFDLHLWPSSSVKVTFTLIIRCILCCWMFVPKMKFVGSVEFEIWTFVLWKPKWRHYDVITISFNEIHIRICKKTYVRAIQNFSLIKLKNAEIYSREVNRELWKKWILSHCDLDLWPKVTNFNRVRASVVSNHLAITASISVHPFGWNFVHKLRAGQTDTHTQRQTAVKIWIADDSTISQVDN